MTKDERKNRVIAQGEFSNHSHVVTGDATVERNGKGEIIIKVGEEGAVLRHILESEWLEGREQWTGEHHDINLKEVDAQIEIGQVGVRHGDVALEKIAPYTYKFIGQVEYDPYEEVIRRVND